MAPERGDALTRRAFGGTDWFAVRRTDPEQVPEKSSPHSCGTPVSTKAGPAPPSRSSTQPVSSRPCLHLGGAAHWLVPSCSPLPPQTAPMAVRPNLPAIQRVGASMHMAMDGGAHVPNHAVGSGANGSVANASGWLNHWPRSPAYAQGRVSRNYNKAERPSCNRKGHGLGSLGRGPYSA